MTITVETLDELDATAVQEKAESLKTMMQEFNPTLDTRRGPVNDLLYRNEAVYAQKSSTEFERLKRSQSLLEINNNPLLADDDIADAAASNYLVDRKSGTFATGEVTMIVSVNEPLTIAVGDTFEASGQSFQTTQAFAVRTSSEQVVSDTDRVLNPTSDGNYSFTITVTATVEGEDSRISKDTSVVPTEPPLNFVRAFAASDFSGGSASETNAALAGRLQTGMACKALSGDVHMDAALLAEESFANVIGTSVIGFGSPEMMRDQHSIFPTSFGGRIDWYIRSQKQPQQVGVTKTATLVQKTEDGFGIWQFGIGRDDLPGYYDITRIVSKDAADEVAGYTVTSDVRTRDMTELDNDGFLPDVQTAEEAVYSRFQAGVVKFKDTNTATASLTENSSTQEYDVTLRGMPLIGSIQDWASGLSVRNRAGDALIKAPVPCFVSISLTIFLPASATAPDTDAIATNIVDLVNDSYSFAGRLPASAIADIVHNSLSGVAHTGAIDILGDIRFPNGEQRRIRTTETLVVPDEPSRMVTPRTVAFLMTAEDVAISTQVADIPEV